MTRTRRLLTLLALLGVCPAAFAQAPVPVGRGSYAASPPPEAVPAAKEMTTRALYFVDLEGRPVPTNQWWTNLIVDKYAGQLWAFPLMVTADAQGVNLFYPIKWNERGTDPVSDAPVKLGGVDFHPADARAKDWGDWTLTFREAEGSARYMDVTLGRGLPYAWLEYHAVAPTLSLTDPVNFYDGAGKPVSFPFAGDRFGFESAGRNYGVFAPDGSRFTRDGDTLHCEFSGAGHYLVVCALPKREDLTAFGQYAFAIPRGSRMDWAYDPAKAQVVTNWRLTTELLKGTEHRLIQGWLPHHCRDTDTDLALNGMQYLTPRGTMRCAVGTDFRLTYPFTGFLPVLPTPMPQNLAHDYQPARMRDYLARYATRKDYGDDTYWGGKSLTQLADYMAMAHETDDPSFETLRGTLRTALTDWLTYTPGEKAHYFARYPNWHALIGFAPSYGSEQFNDNHFHLGYFTRAAAMLGFADPTFLRDYGGMARLVAKQYANWDRADTDFPFLRCFDVWEGHSWAGGLSSPTGDNQESSSEAVQSWGGLFLLGVALGDKDMTAAGVMGYAMETRAAQEYWLNVHGDNFAPNFGHPSTGMVWSGGNLYGTYFSDDPAWISGIQWLPMSPLMAYTAQDAALARRRLQTMLAERKAKKGDDSIHSMGVGLGNVVLSYQQQFDPDGAAAQMDALWDANDPVARDNDTGGLTYYLAHADRMLGPVQWDYHMSLPTACVYRNERTRAFTYVVYNPGALPQRVTVYRGQTPVGTLSAPARTLTRATSLAP